MSTGRLRILHAIRSVDPRGGGAIEGVKQMSAVHQNLGHRVDLVCLDSPTDPWVTECPLRCFALGPSLTGYGYASAYVQWIRRHRTDYDVVVIDGIWQYHAFGVWRALRRTSTPYVVFTHGMLDPWFKNTYPLKHLKKWLYWPWADYRVLRDSRAVFFTCEEERRLAKESFWLYRCREVVVNYGTGNPDGDPEVQRLRFVDRFPVVKEKKILLFLGRVHIKKGNDLLLRAFANFLRTSRNSACDWHLIIAGPTDDSFGQEMQELSAQLGIQSDVTWTGMVSGDLKWGAFYNADAFILPSHQENFGVAVAEALACGVPVLISNKVNIWREIVEDGAGLVETDDLDGTEHLLQRWCALVESEKSLIRQRAFECFQKRFKIEKSAAAFTAALDQLGVRAKTQ